MDSSLTPQQPDSNGKHFFEIRKLALVVVVDERDADGEAVRLDIELGPYLFPSPAKCAASLEEDLPVMLADLNERGTLQPAEASE